MEQSLPSEGDSHSSSQEIPRRLWNPKGHYRIRMIPPLASILSHMHPIHILRLYFFKIHFNITLPTTPTSPMWSFPLIF
jgi:hypothetical protein